MGARHVRHPSAAAQFLSSNSRGFGELRSGVVGTFLQALSLPSNPSALPDEDLGCVAIRTPRVLTRRAGVDHDVDSRASTYTLRDDVRFALYFAFLLEDAHTHCHTYIYRFLGA